MTDNRQTDIGENNLLGGGKCKWFEQFIGVMRDRGAVATPSISLAKTALNRSRTADVWSGPSSQCCGARYNTGYTHGSVSLTISAHGACGTSGRWRDMRWTVVRSRASTAVDTNGHVTVVNARSCMHCVTAKLIPTGSLSTRARNTLVITAAMLQ